MNPFVCYIFSFAVALIAYSLNWSSNYPQLSTSLLLFLLVTIAAHAVVGYFWRRKSSRWHEILLHEDQRPLFVTLFIYFLWLLDFLYEGGIPLFKILFNQPYNYRMFGVPSLHVFTVTFASFYTVYLFHLYLSTRKKLILVLYVINLAAALLIYSRAMLVFNLASSLIIFLYLQKKWPRWMLFSTPLAAIIFIYLFGVLGTLRMSREGKIPYNNARFIAVGGAKQAFKESILPDEFFWSYIYVTSALANLQQNILLAEKLDATPARIFSFFNNEMVLDFISKRVNVFWRLRTERLHTITGPFNVSTVYSGSYSYLGWSGMSAMGLVILLIPWLYLKILPGDSPFFLTGLAILCTMFVFMVYDNTIRFTGLGFQLVYPVLFTWLNRKHFFDLIKPKPSD